MFIRRLVFPTVLLLFALAGCSKPSEMQEVKRRIAQLESELAVEKAKNTALIAAAPFVPSITTTASDSKPNLELNGTQWDYDVREDKMTGGSIRLASVLSTNQVNFGSPYSGAQNGRLLLRIDPKYGRDVIFSIERGQLLCWSYQDCEVLIRFDEGKPERFAAVGPADNSSETLFIRGYDRFVGKLRKAKMVRLSVNVYQEGSPVFEFDVSGFEPFKLTGKKN